MESPLMCQNFSLSRFAGNVNCSSVWSLPHWSVWQFPSLRVAEALSIDCDVRWHTVSHGSCLKQRARIIVIRWQTRSTMMILINDFQNIYGNDLLKTGSFFWLKCKNTTDSQTVSCNVIQHITTSMGISQSNLWNINNPNNCGLVVHFNENPKTRSDNTLLMPLRIIPFSLLKCWWVSLQKDYICCYSSYM